MSALWSDTHDYESVIAYESKYLSNAIYNLYEDLAVQREEIESLKAQLDSKWISVEDRLPEKSGVYVCLGITEQLFKLLAENRLLNDPDDIGGCYFNGSIFCEELPSGLVCEVGYISHWLEAGSTHENIHQKPELLESEND